MTKKPSCLDELISGGTFRLAPLNIEGIDNKPVFDVFGPGIADQEIALLSREMPSGDAYMRRLHEIISGAVSQRQPLPVVRFADGEYAFYRGDLSCNGLYNQAESVNAIRKIMTAHIEALRKTSQKGQLAPLVFPGNTEPKPEGLLSFLKRKKSDSSAVAFLDFLKENGIRLTGENYVPFYVVYAYLTSAVFISLMNGRKICILNSECSMSACVDWFAGRGSRPEITFVEIPKACVATRWPEMRESILPQIRAETDLCLAGAGAGALLVCADVAERLSIPAIDAGHVLNMMNDRIDKSNGLRLYTLRK